MKIYVNVEARRYAWKTYLAETRRDAVALVNISNKAGCAANVIWLPETAKDIRTATKLGRFWARKVWHFGNVPESKAKHSAIRAWSKVAKIMENKQ